MVPVFCLFVFCFRILTYAYGVQFYFVYLINAECFNSKCHVHMHRCLSVIPTSNGPQFKLLQLLCSVILFFFWNNFVVLVYLYNDLYLDSVEGEREEGCVLTHSVSRFYQVNQTIIHKLIELLTLQK